LNSGVKRHDYRLFGLAIRSEVELGELAPLPEANNHDVVIRQDTLSEDLPCTAGYHQLHDGGLLVIENVGRFLARDGRDLLVEPAVGVPSRNLRLFLLGSAMAMLLHQRGLLPLHANAVVLDGSAYAFTGPSGSGKSTLAAWFQDRGLSLLCDDVCVIDFEANERPVAWPGLPRLRLWRDALERSGRKATDFRRSYEEEGGELEKYDVPAAARLVDRPYPLGGIVLLDRGNQARLDRLSAAEGFATIFGNLYRGEFLSGSQREAAWRACLRVAAQVPVSRWWRPWSVADYDRHVQELLARIGDDS
jgi:hypothetical protein